MSVAQLQSMPPPVQISREHGVRRCIRGMHVRAPGSEMLVIFSLQNIHAGSITTDTFARHSAHIKKLSLVISKHMRVHVLWGDAAARGAVSIDVVAEALGVGVGVFHG